MKTTANYGLKKPDLEDNVDITVLNGNMDIVDAQLKKLNTYRTVTLKAASWTGTAAPYTQDVTVAGVTASSNLLLVSALEDGAAETAQKAYTKAFSIVASGTAVVGAGKVTFKAYKKPATDITVGLCGA